MILLTDHTIFPKTFSLTSLNLNFMHLKINELRLINFKGISDLTIKFSDFTTISGQNATGKSTVQDAFSWLLFGKNSLDQSDFGIKTFDPSGKVIEKIEHEVTGLLTADGVPLKLTRILREKWSKSSGSDEVSFKGNETIYFINEVPKLANEYQAYISSLIPADTFKLLTNPFYFNSLHWEKRRQMLISISGVQTDEEILSPDSAFTELLSIMRTQQKTIEDLKKEYAAKKINLKKALDLIPARLDENNRDTPVNVDFVAIEEEIKLRNIAIAGLEKIISDVSSEVENLTNKRSELLIKKNNLHQQISRIEDQTENELSKLAQKNNYAIEVEQINIKNIEASFKNIDININSKKDKIETLQKELDDHKKSWSELNAMSFEWSDDTCPACGQSLPQDQLSERKATAFDSFTKRKVSQMNGIVNNANQLKEQISNYQTQLTNSTTESEKYRLKVNEHKNNILTLEASIQIPPTLEEKLSSNIEYLDLLKTFNAIEIPELVVPDVSAIRAKTSIINLQINELSVKLSARETISSLRTRRETLLKEQKEFAQQLANLEKIEFIIEKAISKRISIVETEINKQFPTVRFRMFTKNVLTTDPSCDCLIAGVPFPDANRAAQINAGIEIINTFSDIHLFDAPIFVDNAESVNHLTKTTSQLIRLVVSNENNLTVTN